MPPLQREGLVVRQLRVLAVGFVAGGHDDTTNAARASGGLQQHPRPLDVALEGGQWAAIRRAYDRLRSQVEDGIDLVLVHGSFDEIVVLDGAMHAGDRTPLFGVDDQGARDAVANDGNDVGVTPHQLGGQPRAQDAGAPRHQDVAILPKQLLGLHHVFQGV